MVPLENQKMYILTFKWSWRLLQCGKCVLQNPMRISANWYKEHD